ncbi:hypothetical protein [Catellatospora paridis]|uniref:hypothetical protein n=1 Tax=Catellatospora paridis TaxID=1617086 RepID=UPI0012D428A9|nr:hypothetical protein [Catellatospora paridis]
MRSSRVLGYGLAVWLGMVGISLMLLPAEGKHEALYESIKLTTMVALVLGFAIRYLRKRPIAAAPEGVLVGLVWAAVTTAGDLGLYLGGAFNIGLDVYFTDVASSYSVMPVITGLAIGLLAPKPTGILSAEAYGAALAAAQPAGHSDTDEFAAMMAAAGAAEPTASPAASTAETDAVAETHTITGVSPTTYADARPEPHAASQVQAEAEIQGGPEIHSAPEAAAPVVPSPAVASHAEATLVGAAASSHAAEETDRPLYIPRGNC